MTMPSGSDPSQFDGSRSGSIIGAMFSGLAGRTQDSVVAQQKQDLQNSTAWGGASSTLFAGLDTTLPFPLAFLKAIIQQFFPFISIPDWNIQNFLADPTSIINEALALIKEVPVLSDLVSIITGGAGNLSDLEAFFQQKWADLQGIVDKIVNAVFGTNTIGNAISSVFDAIAHLLGLSNNAQATADAALQQAVILNAKTAAAGVAGGKYVYEDFNGAQAFTLDTAVWDQLPSGTGAGTYGRDGSGSGHWFSSGGGIRAILNRNKTALATSTQMTSFQYPGVIGVDVDTPELYLFLRVNAADTTWVRARITSINGGLYVAEIGYSVTGSYTMLGTATQFAWVSSPLWEFRAGTATSSRQFQLLMNGNVVCDRTDTGAASVIDNTNNLFAGFGAQNGRNFFLQNPPPDVQVWSAADRVAA